MRLKKAWYIFLYHNVDWQLSPFLWNMKGSISPDIFEQQVRYLSTLGDLSNVQTAFDRLKNGDLDSPLISFWFDDFYTGVTNYADAILNSHSVTGAISVNSDFCGRKRNFWRSQLCFLKYQGRLNQFVGLAGKEGIKLDFANIKESTISQFSPKLIQVLDDFFVETMAEVSANSSFSIFDHPQNLKHLSEKGWLISNHTASHYPVSENSAISLIDDQFHSCDSFIHEQLGFSPKFWVLPFDRTAHESEQFKKWATQQTEKVIVRVGDKPNTAFETPFLYRINTPTTSLSDLKRHLQNLQRA